MSRLDHIKNVTGMLEWYGRNERLRDIAHLFIVGGYIDPDRSADAEEQDHIETMHELMDRYQLHEHVRWVEMQTEKPQVGALYRYIADTRGAFVQPALFEAFGLTVIEAMASGLPVFATRYGGPLEIIEDRTSGFHIDPNHGDEATDRMAEFFERCADDPGHWEQVSRAAVDRVEARYTWKLYARRLLTLSRIYGFWKYISNIEREEMRRYLEMFYGLMFKPLAEKLANGKPAKRVLR
jgi:sucrose synthase